MAVSRTGTGPDTSSAHHSRRTRPAHGFYRAVACITTFAMLFGGLLLMPTGATAAPPATTTAPLNLRTGPGVDHEVILVIPEGAPVAVNGDSEAGYYPVTYDGTSGYAAADFISFGDSNADTGSTDTGNADDTPVSESGPTGTAWVTAWRLNFRSGPGQDYSVIDVLVDGTAVELTGQQANGYWQAVANGTTGWLAADYLTTQGAPPASEPAPDADNDGSGDTSDTGGNNGAVAVGDTVTGSATVTVGLNLRSGPGLDYAVRSVMPAGASVELRGDPQGGFYPLNYNGTLGWASGDFLNIGSADAPDPAPQPDPGSENGNGTVAVGDSVTGTATVTAALNLRSGPGLDYAVRSVMPAGATVELRGAPQGDYYPLSYNGTTGWAHGNWLDSGGETDPAPEPTPAPAPDDGSNDNDAVGVGDTVTGSATVTAGLNLRSGPGLDYAVRTTMPAGAVVELRGDPQGAWYPLSYNGTTGWAHGDWLNIGGTGSEPAPDAGSGAEPTPGPDTGNTPDYLYTTVALNMRSGPSTDTAVVRMIPPNTRVAVTGAPQNGFYPVTWAQFSGWMYGDYLSTTWQQQSTEGKEDIIAIIHAAADAYGQPREDMVRVARCESHLNPDAINTDYPNDPDSARGLFQFRPSTWATTPYADQDIFDAQANAYAAAWMWSVGRRDEWACQ